MDPRSQADIDFLKEMNDIAQEYDEGEEAQDEADNDASLLGHLVRLIRAFEEEEGQSDAVYDATAGLIEHLLGPDTAVAFIESMDGVDDRHYLPDGAAERLLGEMWASL